VEDVVINNYRAADLWLGFDVFGGRGTVSPSSQGLAAGIRPSKSLFLLSGTVKRYSTIHRAIGGEIPSSRPLRKDSCRALASAGSDSPSASAEARSDITQDWGENQRRYGQCEASLFLLLEAPEHGQNRMSLVLNHNPPAGKETQNLDDGALRDHRPQCPRPAVTFEYSGYFLLYHLHVLHRWEVRPRRTATRHILPSIDRLCNITPRWQIIRLPSTLALAQSKVIRSCLRLCLALSRSYRSSNSRCL